MTPILDALLLGRDGGSRFLGSLTEYQWEQPVGLGGGWQAGPVMIFFLYSGSSQIVSLRFKRELFSIIAPGVCLAIDLVHVFWL